jgi:hypothetical protein
MCWAECLVDASEAAHCTLNLPMYLLTHPKERQRLGIPHYRVGKLVRFKLQDMEALDAGTGRRVECLISTMPAELPQDSRGDRA